MTKLLVSVRSHAEALLAADAGVDLLDVKEPSQGSLGRASAAVWQEIAALEERVPLSAALGELRDWDDRIAQTLPPAFAYAKLGLASMAEAPWQRLWERALRQLPGGVQRVAVVYADQQAAGAPARAEIVAAAHDLGCRAVLVDTFVKDSRGLLTWWSLDEVAVLVDDAQQRGMLAVVAGSLALCDVANLLPLEPDYVAVRGAVCSGGRAAALSPARLLQFVQTVRAKEHRAASEEAGKFA